MSKDKKQRKDKSQSTHPPLKPKNPDTKGAPNDQDPHAQYEDKDES
jgi:hypothetical protein